MNLTLADKKTTFELQEYTSEKLIMRGALREAFRFFIPMEGTTFEDLKSKFGKMELTEKINVENVLLVEGQEPAITNQPILRYVVPPELDHERVMVGDSKGVPCFVVTLGKLTPIEEWMISSGAPIKEYLGI